jgi:hypothetical protein
MSMTTTGGTFAAFTSLARGEEAAFGEALRQEGFAAVRRFLDDYRVYLQTFDEGQIEEADELLARGRTALPEPGRVSPSWVRIWEHYEGIARYKREIFDAIEKGKRTGEWQVLIDNPFTNGSVAVYPALTFLEAAYMFAYFRTDLEKNEYIRMQKVETVIARTGKDA